MKILILGDTGLIGSALVKKLINQYEIIGLSRSTAQFDYQHISFDLESTAITSILEEVQPHLMISASRGDFDMQLQCHKEMIDYANEHQIPIHFYSTANVFDGSDQTVHDEMDEVSSVSPYGNYKIAVEELIQTLPSYVIIRLPMVFGEHSPRLKDIQKSLSTHEKLKVFDPLEISIVLDSYVADVHAFIIKERLSGIFHLTSQDTISMKSLYEALIPNEIFIENIPTQTFALKSSQEIVQKHPIEVNQIIEKLKTYLMN